MSRRGPGGRPAAVPREPVPRRAMAQVLESGDLQRDAFQEQHREEEPGLVAGEPAGEALTLGGLLLRPDKGAHADVRVLVDVVGIGVVAYVFVVPPCLVHPEQQVGVHKTDGASRPAVAGYLGVPGIVSDERGARPEDRQRQREEQGPPGVAEEDHAGDHGAQRNEIDGDARGVPAGSPLQEALPLHGPQQRREVAALRRTGSGSGSGCGSGGTCRARLSVTDRSGTARAVAGAFRCGGYGLGHDVSGLWKAALTCRNVRGTGMRQPWRHHPGSPGVYPRPRWGCWPHPGGGLPPWATRGRTSRRIEMCPGSPRFPPRARTSMGYPRRPDPTSQI